MARTEALSELGSGGQTPRGPLRVNAPVPFMLHAIAPRLPEFQSRYPEIDLRFDMTDDVFDLISAHADVAIRSGPLEDSDLLKRHLGRTLWQLVAAPHYPDAHGWPKNLAELSSLEQVRFSAPAHNNLLTLGEVETSVDVPTAVEASNGEAVRRLVSLELALQSSLISWSLRIWLRGDWWNCSRARSQQSPSISARST